MYHSYYQHIKYLTIISLTGIFLLSSCSSSRLAKLDTPLKNESLLNSFHGLVVLDAKRNKIVHNTNGDRYFTPASNTKIITLFTGLKMIPEHFPTLKYVEKNDSIQIVPSGDPSWLHPYFKDSTATNFLKDKKHISIYLKGSEEERFGPGWAWEDYGFYFSPEKSPLPLYGNVVSLSNVDGLEASPLFFLDNVMIKNTSVNREEYKNQFYIHPNEQDSLQVPFIINDNLTKNLLEATLKKKITLLDSFPSGKKEILYGIKADSIFKRMMHESDNFLAEQILMTASSTLSDTLGTQRAIKYMLNEELSFLEHQPRWVDGSGLSRYNLFTPKSFVQILQKLHQEVDEERLFTLFPNWNASGTISKWEDQATQPFIFAKSGSLGNNYNLSGYLKTKSGKLLIFSFMNNHFRIPSAQIRNTMYSTLKKLHDSY
ncbi:D-alanyl-D-alanine carboxypeptidase [Flagellimonas pacifica]|uniref:D-alanyl-D-alanine carboxypeptidase / D-alanyl-D-alanine-endopeptidase (Penicillin-binding protein 4) n=1 Tax=Flagellimonas pacifica TaxID=1247520 RepID=A0A285MTG3_9FLAO|nr:D-alanyl-D-alanine carboxypeptidase [Allomuricauda parva]SNZ00490.1 D-alanyl-D-alanine carboxypeptidase / D-alanyl-D-alanine-endopeptidase (penicillin-binding protein 4) [Allomuricauda parva]